MLIVRNKTNFQADNETEESTLVWKNDLQPFYLEQVDYYFLVHNPSIRSFGQCCLLGSLHHLFYDNQNRTQPHNNLSVNIPFIASDLQE